MLDARVLGDLVAEGHEIGQVEGVDVVPADLHRAAGGPQRPALDTLIGAARKQSLAMG